MNNFCYKNLIRPWLFSMDAEEAHYFAHSVARKYKFLLPLIDWEFKYKGNDLNLDLVGTKIANPVGLAAGFDKNGDLTDVLGHFGFGFAEIGSVTAQSCQGNPKPRIFRLPEDRALINRLGLNSKGADWVAQKLQSSKFSLPIGINIAKTNDPKIVGEATISDMLYSFKKIKDLPVAYVTLNASCPNTQEGIMAEAKILFDLFGEVQKANNRKLPILVKLSPDSSKHLTEDIVKAAKHWHLAGYVIGNTSTSRNGLATASAEVQRIGNGGLSGPPIKDSALELCRIVSQLKDQSQIIIGCGGITNGADAYEFIRSGASAVMLYTALVYEGPTLVRQINEELSRLLAKDKLILSQAIGKDNQRD